MACKAGGLGKMGKNDGDRGGAEGQAGGHQFDFLVADFIMLYE